MVSAGAGEIRVRDLSVAFDTRGSHQTVLDHLNFDIRPGEFFVLVGQSGCGKTTFLRTLQGLQKPSTGEISVSDKTIEGPGPDRGFVFSPGERLRRMSRSGSNSRASQKLLPRRDRRRC
jgi:NitT/TauT family transport system ATP-binding protein